MATDTLASTGKGMPAEMNLKFFYAVNNVLRSPGTQMHGLDFKPKESNHLTITIKWDLRSDFINFSYLTYSSKSSISTQYTTDFFVDVNIFWWISPLV